MVTFKNLPQDFVCGTERVIELLDLKDKHREIEVSKGDSLRVTESKIVFSDKCEFFRCLGLWAENIEKDKFDIKQKNSFKTLAAMLDVSRGGVITVDGAKKYIDYLALMGVDMFMLYMEDLFELENRNYFGYMRGKYSKDELREIDDYAFEYGIEVSASIECYGHMEQYLAWKEADNVRDTNRVLLAGCEKTYEMIDEMIECCSSSLRSRRINVGLDEGINMLRGKYTDIHGRNYDVNSVFMQHVLKISEICNKYSMKPMMWSDMFFTMSDNNYYDAGEVPECIVKNIPENMDLVYWNYNDTAVNPKMFERHKCFNRNIVFAGAVHAWLGLTANYSETIPYTLTSMEQCLQYDVDEYIMTVWANDGAECDFFASLLSMQVMAEKAYGNEENYRERFNFITGADWEVFENMSGFYGTEKTSNGMLKYNGKRILWSDILMGFEDKFLAEHPHHEHYKKYADFMHKPHFGEEKWHSLYAFLTSIYELMEIKTYIAENLYIAYKNNDVKVLRELAEICLPNLGKAAAKTLADTKKLWFESRKGFGFEFYEGKYALLISRSKTAVERIEDYLSGRINKIDELEEERLDFPPNRICHYDLYTAYRPVG